MHVVDRKQAHSLNLHRRRGPDGHEPVHGDRDLRETPEAESGAMCPRENMTQTTTKEVGKLTLRQLPGHIRFNVNERIRLGQPRIHVYEIHGVFGGWIVTDKRREPSEDEDLVVTVEVRKEVQ